MSLPTRAMASPSIKTSARCWPSAFTTVPFWMSVDIVALELYWLGGGALCPGLRCESVIHLLHGDAALDGANQGAEIATDTVMFVDPGNTLERRDGMAAAEAIGIELGYRCGRDTAGCFCFHHGWGACDVGRRRRAVQM